MHILAVETSCDETSVAILDCRGGLRQPRFEVLSNIVSSQVKFHAKFGGVVPSLAARKHRENLPRVLALAFRFAKLKKDPTSINAIAVTKGYGLLPALVQGVAFARELALKWNKPIVGVNHMEGHLYSNWLSHEGAEGARRIGQIRFPLVALIVSGGHTGLLLVKGYGKYETLGETLDDAAGECFDKGARLLGLAYPGGPLIDNLAKLGNPQAFTLPSPLIYAKGYQFSYSGLKTALLYFLRDRKLVFTEPLSARRQKLQADIAASFQDALVKPLIKKTFRAAQNFRAKTILVGGGVAANSYLLRQFRKEAERLEVAVPILFPERSFITDNAAMIGAAGYVRLLLGKRDDPRTLDADAELELQEQ
jgi:N6-L-threonylcarbamoyladenine synthase